MLRRILFWVHLSAGVVAGLVIAVMSVTGAALAFEKEVLAWAESEVRHTAPPPPGASRVPLARLMASASAAAGKPVTAVTLENEPDRAVALTVGRDLVYFANPYTGEIREAPAGRLRAFFRTLLAWHRWLGADGEGRAVGRAITGACNAAFAVLVLTGWYLWWPRSWSWRALRPALVPSPKSTGKARDWNWHNALGFWSAPVLLVLTLTGLVISYRWAGNLPYVLTRTHPSAPPDASRPAAEAGAAKSPDEQVAAVTAAYPDWQTLTLRSARPSPRRGDPEAAAARAPGQRQRSAAPAMVSASVVVRGQQPRFAPRQLTLDPVSGEITGNESYVSMNAGRRLRSWLRFLHTGEALGLPGKILAAAACCAALVLIWTGLALAARRLLRR